MEQLGSAIQRSSWLVLEGMGSDRGVVVSSWRKFFRANYFFCNKLLALLRFYAKLSNAPTTLLFVDRVPSDTPNINLQGCSLITRLIGRRGEIGAYVSILARPGGRALQCHR